MANTLEYIFILSCDLLKHDNISVAIITDGEIEAQRNYLTHQSYKATKSQSPIYSFSNCFLLAYCVPNSLKTQS